MGLVNTIKGDLYLIENCLAVTSRGEKTGKRLIKEAEERLSEIYKIADKLEL